LPYLSQIDNAYLPPYITSIDNITGTGNQIIEITGEYFTPVTQLNIPGVTVNSLEIRSPNKIKANISKNNLSGNMPVTLTNGNSSNTFWVDGIKAVDIINDPFWSSVALFLKCEGVNNSTNIIDSSRSPKNITKFGDVKVSTARAKHGTSSLYFDGTGDYLEIATNGLINNAVFTLEAWLSPISFSNGFFDTAPGYGGALRHYAGRIEHQSVNGVNVTLPDNIWSHLAIVFNGSVMKVFVNGVLQGFVNFTTWTYITLLIGSINRGWFYQGYMDSIRLTLAERYTNNFNPETDTFLN
jgi:hypothetical protein